MSDAQTDFDDNESPERPPTGCLKWRERPNGNHIGFYDGGIITVFWSEKSDSWSWVCDGHFGGKHEHYLEAMEEAEDWIEDNRA